MLVSIFLAAFYFILKGMWSSGIVDDAEQLFIRNTIYTDPTANCNDGSPPVYYIRRPLKPSNRWVIRIPGGHCCYDNTTCTDRYESDWSRMSSLDLPESVLWYLSIHPNNPNNPNNPDLKK